MSLTAIPILVYTPMMVLAALVVAGNWETLEQWDLRYRTPLNTLIQCGK
jgi:hypothetical protein